MRSFKKFIDPFKTENMSGIQISETLYSEDFDYYETEADMENWDGDGGLPLTYEYKDLYNLFINWLLDLGVSYPDICMLGDGSFMMDWFDDDGRQFNIWLTTEGDAIWTHSELNNISITRTLKNKEWNNEKSNIRYN